MTSELDGITLIFNGLKMGKVFKSNTRLLILDREVRLWNETLKRRRYFNSCWNYDTEIIFDLINRIIQDFRVKYQESSIGSENLAHLQSIENKCKKSVWGDELELFSVKLVLIDELEANTVQISSTVQNR